MKRVLTLLLCLCASIFIVVFLPRFVYGSETVEKENVHDENSLIEQPILGLSETAHQVTKIYYRGDLIGVLNNRSKLDTFLKSMYQSLYQEDFPDSSVELDKDIYLTTEESYFIYKDVDDEIMKYIEENQFFSLKTTAVEFSDENGVYARIYVNDIALYESALQKYLTYFIPEEELALLNSGQKTPELKTYGSRSVGLSILQTITTSEAYASADEIMRTEEEILDYIEYGDNKDRVYYTVQQYDTVAGVGSKNNGLSATQVMNINRDKISSVDQVLSEGEQLCVTYFTPIIDIVVNKESMKKEVIYPSTEYTEDETIRVGSMKQIQAGVNGSKNTLYAERWINGVLVSGTLQSSVDTLQPVNEIIAVGTLEIPGVGTGQYRWPVDNPHISCPWGCYYGHQAIDVQNMYDKYGLIYAADRGVVVENAYHFISGNYLVIDHNNGQRTYYGHMNVPSPIEEGTIVDKGDVIGQLGMTGYATGPHTHFYIEEENEDGIYIKLDPCNGYLDCTVIR